MTTKTDHEMAQLMYGDSQFRDTQLNSPHENLLLDLEQVNDANESWRSALRAVEVSQPEGEQVTQLIQRYTRTPPTSEEKAAWLKESSEALARLHGPERGRERVELAMQLAKRSPVLAKTLAAAGISSHPRVVEMLAERAFSARLAGRL